MLYPTIHNFKIGTKSDEVYDFLWLSSVLTYIPLEILCFKITWDNSSPSYVTILTLNYCVAIEGLHFIYFFKIIWQKSKNYRMRYTEKGFVSAHSLILNYPSTISF